MRWWIMNIFWILIFISSIWQSHGNSQITNKSTKLDDIYRILLQQAAAGPPNTCQSQAVSAKGCQFLQDVPTYVPYRTRKKRVYEWCDWHCISATNYQPLIGYPPLQTLTQCKHVILKIERRKLLSPFINFATKMRFPADPAAAAAAALLLRRAAWSSSHNFSTILVA